MKQERLDKLAHEIAEEDCKSVLECNLNHVCARGQSRRWYNLRTAHRHSRWAIYRAARYLDARGLLIHHRTKKHLVRWEGMD
jgi:hypothetical protein